jgi:putative FmdB family regulatory protein
VPLYEFVCRDCGKTFEIVATIKEYADGLEAHCPACKSKKVERVLGSFTVLGTTKKSEGDESSFDDTGPDLGPEDDFSTDESFDDEY